jgi:uncharacterized membrane protein YqaE (UPF0057 family)
VAEIFRAAGRDRASRHSRQERRPGTNAASPCFTCHDQRKPLRKPGPMDLVRILLAILLPPLGVFLQVGIGLHFWVNILLTLLGYIPGIIHAIYVIIKK